MVLPNLPPINITLEDVRRYLRESERAEPVVEETEPADDAVVGWARVWVDPDDHSKGQTCEPLTYRAYKDIQAATEESSYTVIESRPVDTEEEA